MLKWTSDLEYTTIIDLIMYGQTLKNCLNIAVRLLMNLYLNKVTLAPLFGISGPLDLHHFTSIPAVSSVP